MGKEFLEKALKTELELGNKVFIPYIMAGDGGLDELIPTLRRLEAHGATAIELGIPFSDPVADGPTIQEAGKRALKHGTTLAGVLDVLKGNRHEVTIPLVFMTYINPIFRYGVSRFFRDCREAGVDGLIIPDLPLEHLDLIEADAVEHGIAIIQLATLTSSEERVKELARRSEGFLYAVTVKGITGARKEFDDVISRHLNLLKEHSPVPVLAGFGISSPEHVKTMSQSCDGVVVGSRIIDLLQTDDEETIKSLIGASKGVRA
ncbi:tryptophan synthase subunit alpha [Rossellomorea marisflavi]|uniref:tryptophan synthase subunit alpha n=1 Tax=Rossellomorea marisflavi TaxID=189381 RepID=UPI0025AFF04E|nr:tryptophan synthase subunit alpha [Rossellomorea marisflavi]MDW4526993.1 tryptophan synthase subunit alpha [Rossellomorea marisflavi]WJV20869.1 tryptophan synthase subunit alpha [Rossellomorea marisflavi]